MTIKIGDIVRHPNDGDIGVVVDKKDSVTTGDTYYAIHWARDGFFPITSYDSLEVINAKKEV